MLLGPVMSWVTVVDIVHNYVAVRNGPPNDLFDMLRRPQFFT